MKYIFVLLNMCCFLSENAIARAKIVELEHTFAEIEGSSWRTDDSFRKAIDVDEVQIPWIFRLSLMRPKPQPVQLASSELGAHFFIDDTVRLYREINICYDQKLKLEGPGFLRALDFFLNKMAGIEQPGKQRPLKVHILKVDSRIRNPSGFALCDILAFQSEEGQFPFSKFQETGVGLNGASGVPELVLGLFYRYSESTIPVISLHPKLDLDFQGDMVKYISDPATLGTKDRVKVDGRSIFFHELGHVLGFAHIHIPHPLNSDPAISVMGIDNSQRNEGHIETRFSAPTSLWRRWDPQQTSIYRSLLWKLSNNKPIPKPTEFFLANMINNYVCVMPNEILDFNFRSWGTVGESGMFDWITKLPETISLRNPFVIEDQQQPLRKIERFSVHPEVDLLVTHSGKPLNESSGLFKADRIENSTYRMKPLTHPGSSTLNAEPHELLFSTLVGSFGNESRGSFILKAAFQMKKKFPASYVPMTRMQVSPDPSECYSSEQN
jgi:hypothetical protein